MSFFWPAFHSEIAVNGHKKKRGSELGNIEIIVMIMGSIAPFIGGYLLGFFSYIFIVILSSVILIIGSIPLLYSKDIKLQHYKFSYFDYLRLRKIPSLRKNSTVFRAEGVQTEMVMILWPIILYLLLDQNFFYIGTLYTVISFVSVGIIIYFKKQVDRKNKNALLKKVTKTLATNWFLRFFALFFGGIFLYAVEIMYKITHTLFSLSFFPIFYNNAQNAGYMNTIIYREWCIHTTKIIISILGIVGFTITNNIYIVFGVFIILAIIASLKIGTFTQEYAQ